MLVARQAHTTNTRLARDLTEERTRAGREVEALEGEGERLTRRVEEETKRGQRLAQQLAALEQAHSALTEKVLSLPASAHAPNPHSIQLAPTHHLSTTGPLLARPCLGQCTISGERGEGYMIHKGERGG